MRLIDPDELERVLRPILTDESCPLHIAAEIDMNLDLMPKVDVVTVRHGKWVDENGNRPYGYRFNWLCSECGRPQHTPTAKLLKEFEEEHRWCHFCGIRMDGKDGEQHG